MELTLTKLSNQLNSPKNSAYRSQFPTLSNPNVSTNFIPQTQIDSNAWADQSNNNSKKIVDFDSKTPTKTDKKLSKQISSKKDDEFKVAGPKKKKKSTKTYIKNSGQGQNLGFEACERKIEIYLGRIANNVKNEFVENYVKQIVNIQIFEQLTTNHKNFKSVYLIVRKSMIKHYGQEVQ
ncbi:hypothetical protein BpHYR1_002998 [Brachionus plicatilis]|uniref:Uncharacterized protein n=1 Tax=Brachionus plicatilis TaxID=10195 RepID=A0A3M7RJD2_BRAPC|nr:hypothetical protein BpHYR1_002998 [Brachionus plicatilis]